eukprot:209332-Rhodomonas_salina.3
MEPFGRCADMQVNSHSLTHKPGKGRSWFVGGKREASNRVRMGEWLGIRITESKSERHHSGPCLSGCGRSFFFSSKSSQILNRHNVTSN